MQGKGHCALRLELIKTTMKQKGLKAEWTSINSCRKILFPRPRKQYWGKILDKKKKKMTTVLGWVLFDASWNPTHFLPPSFYNLMNQKTPKKTQSKSMFKPQHGLTWRRFQTSWSKPAAQEHTSRSDAIYLPWEQRSCPALSGTGPASPAPREGSNSCQFRQNVKNSSLRIGACLIWGHWGKCGRMQDIHDVGLPDGPWLKTLRNIPTAVISRRSTAVWWLMATQNP